MQLLADFIFEFQNENDLLLIISVISCISFFFFLDKKILLYSCPEYFKFKLFRLWKSKFPHSKLQQDVEKLLA